MTFSKIRQVLGLLVAVLALGIAVPAFAQTGGLTGKATLQDGSPCVKCTVLIERLDIKGTYKVKTNKKGEYVYIGLPIGNYKMTLLDPTGKTLFFFDNKHIGMGDPIELNFNLPKEAKQEQANPEVVKKVEEQQKEQKQFAGLKEIFEQGNELYGQQKYSDAAAMFEKALPLANGKNISVVLSRLADAYDKAHQYDQSIATYQKALTVSPDDAGLYNNLGNVYVEMNKIPEAQQSFQKAATLDPTHAGTYYFNLGAIMYNSGKMDEAAAAFKKATEIDPNNAEAYYLTGQALMGKASMGTNGKVSAPPGTVEAFKKYLDLAPNGPNAAAAKAMLQTLEGNVPTTFKRKKKG